MEWNDGTDSSMQKKEDDDGGEETRMGWRASKTRNIIFSCFSQFCVVVISFFSLFLCVCFCFLTAIKLQSALVGASKRKIHKYTNGRSKNDSIVESIDTAKHKQLVNSIRKQNHQRSLNFSMLEIVCELHS